MPDMIEDLLETALSAAAGIDRPAVKSSAYSEIAGIFLEIGQQPRCLQLLADSLKFADAVKRPEEKAARLALIARIYGEAGSSPERDALFSRARLLARAAETPDLSGEALFRIASEYIDAGLPDQAVEVLSEIQEMAVNPENNMDSAAELIDIAEYYLEMERGEKAGEMLTRALLLVPEIDDDWLKAERLIAIAEIYRETGNSTAALELLSGALDAVSRVEQTARPNLMLKAAALYLDLDHKPEALDILSTVLGIANQDEMPFSRAADLMEIAGLLFRSGETARSDSLLCQAQAILDSINDLKDKTSGLIRLAGLRKTTGQNETAFSVAEEAERFCEALEDRRTQIYLLGELSTLFLKLNRPDRAQETVTRIGELVSESRVKTSGLRVAASELAAEGAPLLGRILAGYIREPDARADAFTGIAGILAESR